MNALTTTQDTRPVPFGSGGLVPHNMDEALRLAEFMSRARTVPKHLQDSPGDCLMAIEQAMRWGMSPFAVAQATSVISGKLMFEGKLVAAAVETSGAIVGQLEYEFSGEGDARAVKVSGTRRGETNPRTVTVVLKDARTGNEMWKRQPDQQLVYHGARVWARRWTPAVILGVYSREEMGPIIEGEAVTTEREAINEAVPLKAAAAAMPPPPKVVDPTVYDAPAKPPKSTPPRSDDQWNVWLGKLADACSVLYHRQELVEVGERATVRDALKDGPEWVQREISDILAANFKRLPEHAPADADALPEIVGEANVGAG